MAFSEYLNFTQDLILLPRDGFDEDIDAATGGKEAGCFKSFFGFNVFRIEVVMLLILSELPFNFSRLELVELVAESPEKLRSLLEIRIYREGTFTRKTLSNSNRANNE